MHVHVEVRNDLSKRQTVSPASTSSTSGSTVQIVGGHTTGWSAQNARLPPVDRSTSQWTTHAGAAFRSRHVSSMCRTGGARGGSGGGWRERQRRAVGVGASDNLLPQSP